MNWNVFTDDWRLKLLALGLAVLMLGAVAFSQNPPNYKDLTVQINYNIAPDGPIVVINPPTTAKVRVTALADVLQSVTPLSVTAIFDLTKASVGPQRVNLSVKAGDARVAVQNPVVPYSLNIDKRVALKLEVHPRTPRIATGWKLLQAKAQCPGAAVDAVCQATFTGPESYQKNLQAYVDYTTEVAGSYTVPNLPVILEQTGQRFDLAAHRTVPDMTLDPLSVNMQIDATSVTQTRQMTLIDAQPARGPAPGYRVTNVTVSPTTVVVKGSPEALARITTTTITLPQIDLGGRTSDYTATVQIPYPEGTDGPVKTAKVTYSIAANPNATP
jgi:YbbR domain-containing protein